MSAQLDLISGNDLSALSSVTQEDLMQAINKIAPLSNIGLIVASATRPDITNNPRFIRYGWLDISTPSTPVLKAYTADRTTLVDLDASWSTVSGALSSILTSMFAARSTTGGVTIGLIKTLANYTDAGNAYYILRVASNGKDVEAVTLDSALSGGGGVALARLATTGIGAGKFIGYNAGVAGYVSIVPSTDLVGASRIAVETNVLPAGSPLYVPRTNAAGTAMEHVTPNDLFANNELAVARLYAASAALGDIITFNGTNWIKQTPNVNLLSTAEVSTTGKLSASTAAVEVHTIAHGLGAVPKQVRVVLVCTTTDLGWAVGDEVEIASARAANGDLHITMTVGADATNVTVLMDLASTDGWAIANKTTGNYGGATEASWTPKVYAWK